jgi:hypothetical protein
VCRNVPSQHSLDHAKVVSVKFEAEHPSIVGEALHHDEPSDDDDAATTGRSNTKRTPTLAILTLCLSVICSDYR